MQNFIKNVHKNKKNFLILLDIPLHSNNKFKSMNGALVGVPDTECSSEKFLLIVRQCELKKLFNHILVKPIL